MGISDNLKAQAEKLLKQANDLRNLTDEISKQCSNYKKTLSDNSKEFKEDEELYNYIKPFFDELGIDKPKLYLNNVLLYKAFIMYTKYNKPKMEITKDAFERLATNYM